MHFKKISLVLAALTLPLWSAAHAAVNPEVVSAEARWLVYADLNALRGSVLGQELIGLAENARMETAGGAIGVNWQKLLATVGTATAYGSNISKDPKQIDGTLVLQGTADLRKIAEGLLIQANLANPQEVAEITDLPFPAYALRKTKAEASEQTEVIVAFPPEPIVIVSKARAQIVKARDVFRGAAPSLAKAGSSPLLKFAAGSANASLFLANTVPADSLFPEEGPQARIFKMASAGALSIGERGAETFAHSELLASSDQMAEKLMKIMQGLTAMLSLAETNDKQLADFMNSVAVERKGDTVTVDLAYSSVRLAQMIKELRKKEPARAPNRDAAVAAQMTHGRSLAEWKAEAGPAPAEGSPAPLVQRTIENVALKNGTLLTLARLNNGGKSVRFDRVEITPSAGGAPLTFRSGYMRTGGPRGNWVQFEFPGAEGSYTLKVSYVNDPEGKATYAVSARDPRAPAAEPEAGK